MSSSVMRGAPSCWFWVVLALLAGEQAAGAIIAGYNPATTVTEHSEIDLDQYDLEECLVDGTDWAPCARDIYENGKNSAKSSSLRTIQGFSTSAVTKFRPLTLASGRNFSVARKFYQYFGDWEYADAFITAALNATAPWDSLPSRWDADEIEDGRQQAIKKGTAYMATYMYTLYEFFRAIHEAQYSDDDLDDEQISEDLVHAWDEGWAFWAGSLESGAGTGVGPYVLAEKRATSFNVNDAVNPNGGTSRVNFKMLAAAQAGRRALEDYDQSDVSAQIVDNAYSCIEQQAFIPLMQGCLLYTYKSETCTSDCGDEYGEVLTFCTAWLPLLAYVNTTASDIIATNMNATSNVSVPLGYTATRDAIYQNLNNMNIKCGDVGYCDSCGDTMATTTSAPWCDDDTVVDYCGFAYPIDESDDDDDDDDESDDDDDDDDCSPWNVNSAGVLSIVVLVPFALLGIYGLVKCCFKESEPAAAEVQMHSKA